MDKQVNFKTSFSGFDKTSVLEYIEQMNQEFADRERDYQDQITSLQSEKEELTNQSLFLRRTIQEKTQEVQNIQCRSTSNDSEIEALRTQVQNLTAALRDKEQELTVQKEQNKLIKNKAEEDECKSKKYDEMAGAIGNVILEAKQEAKSIVAAAQKKSDQMLEDANKQVADIVSDSEARLVNYQKEFETLKTKIKVLRTELNMSIAIINANFNKLEAQMDESAAKAVEQHSKEEPAQHTEDAPENKAGTPNQQEDGSSVPADFFR